MVYSIELWAITFDFVGKIMIALMALLVHKKLRKEGKIDQFVLRRMKLEQIVGLFAILFLILGYVLHTYSLS